MAFRFSLRLSLLVALMTALAEPLGMRIGPGTIGTIAAAEPIGPTTIAQAPPSEQLKQAIDTAKESRNAEDRGSETAGLRVEALGSTDGQATQKAEEDKILQQCRQDINKNQHDAALSSCNQALVTFQKFKNLSGEAKALNNLGLAFKRLKQYDKGITYYQRALALIGKTPDKQLEAKLLNNLGDIYYDWGKYEKSIAFYKQALLM
jgi:tetratricopeptide (TPR) repeat protein